MGAISRRTLLCQLAAGAAGAVGMRMALAEETAAPPAKRPNFVVIYADDLGYGDLGCYGNTSIRTPNLDTMAADGLRWTDFYNTSPVCTPSRAGLLTGRYPIRLGFHHVLFPFSEKGMDAGEMTIAEALKPQGYATGCIGKWHLGHHLEDFPTRQGFDYYFGIPYSNDMDVEKRGDPPIPIYRNEAIIEQPANQDTLTKRYTEEAVRFIGEHKDAPFFLYVPHNMPHVPIHASEDFAGKSGKGLYTDVIEELDWSVGQILASLKANGVDDNTLVLFLSDNGPWLERKENGGTAGPMRKGKGTTFEGGIRTPCIMRWPGRIAPGGVQHAPAITLDILPTLLALAGAPPVTDRPLDGLDITPMIEGAGARPKEDFFFFHGGELQAMRSGNWKVKAPDETAKNEDQRHGWLLFDLSQDPGEQHDHSAGQPELLNELRARMEGFLDGLGSLPPKKA